MKELYQQTVKETALHITRSKIEAIMKKKITKSGCRVYRDGFIGIAGTLGEPSAATWDQAEANLSKKIAYPFGPEANNRRIRDLRTLTIGEEEFAAEMEELLAALRRDNPEFIFSNKIKLLETEISLRNDNGLCCTNYDKSVEIGLLVKHVDSMNIFDTLIVWENRSLEKDRIIKTAHEYLNAYQREVKLPEKNNIPVIFQQGTLLSKVTESLNGETVGLGTSLFSDKISQKVFHNDFTVYQDHTEDKLHTPFFDMEGVVNPQDKAVFIDNGVILKPYTDKKQAAAFSYERTGTAGGGYDDVPFLGYAGLAIKPGEKTLSDILNGEYGIMVIMASGGDYTNDGNYATPVQMAYLTDGVNLLGRLPELNLSGNMYGIFGEDFMGVSTNKPLMGERALVVRMKLG